MSIISRFEEIFETLLRIDFGPFEVGGRGYFSPQTSEAKKVGSIVESCSREIEH
jgi:hypothetical protein